ncbi:L,D-transpeptidase family protein [Streptomyces sp. NPDC093970]|uniref:L,D-transpeptidase family protein n=1 Tax=unclassified Streptomyces TaxID=2593676 RepID=UPI00341E427D
MSKRVPEKAQQAVVVYGDGRNSDESTVVLYQKQGNAWKTKGSWRAHNGRSGWTTDHRLDDDRSPVGVFSLTDAGGAQDDPGSHLRYWYDDNAFTSMIDEDVDDDTAHQFDYVIAIDYNRLKGVPPFDWTRPQGVEKGGGIWLHLDHGDGTSACVTVPEAGMKTLLRTLDPHLHPVVVMGDRDRLKA